MADMRYAAVGGPEVQDYSAEQSQHPIMVGRRPLDPSSGVARMVPTPEEARRANDAAKRAQVIAEQSVSGWGGTSAALLLGAQEEAGRQIEMEQHEAALRSLDARGATASVREAYMRQNRLRYGVGGRLVQDPPLRNMNAVGCNYEAGKMFSRSDILAILKAQKCLNDSHMVPAMREGGDDVLRSLIRIFENLE